MIVLVTLLVHASKLKVPLTKLLATIRETSKTAERKERRETEIMKARESLRRSAMGQSVSGKNRSSTVVVNPLNDRNQNPVQVRKRHPCLTTLSLPALSLSLSARDVNAAEATQQKWLNDGRAEKTDTDSSSFFRTAMRP